MSACQEMTKDVPSVAEAVQNVRHPVCLIVLGMAGSGKTTFVQRLVSHLYGQRNQPYAINLDPACLEVPYPANIGWLKRFTNSYFLYSEGDLCNIL
jgi:polynucleotide 5'-kinase involved in rRNA processing